MAKDTKPQDGASEDTTLAVAETVAEVVSATMAPILDRIATVMEKQSQPREVRTMNELTQSMLDMPQKVTRLIDVKDQDLIVAESDIPRGLPQWTYDREVGTGRILRKHAPVCRKLDMRVTFHWASLDRASTHQDAYLVPVTRDLFPEAPAHVFNHDGRLIRKGDRVLMMKDFDLESAQHRKQLEPHKKYAEAMDAMHKTGRRGLAVDDMGNPVGLIRERMPDGQMAEGRVEAGVDEAQLAQV